VYLWDPVERTIRLWAMGSNGAWSQGVVDAEVDTIQIRTEGITPEGKPRSMTPTLKRTGTDSMTVRFTELEVDGQPQPDSPEYGSRRK